MAHRGDQTHAPENTLAAFREALRLGVDCIELDVRRSRDDRLLVIHDATLERTTNGTGRVDALTFAELRALDAGAWFAPTFAGEPIPELAEVLALVGREAGLAVEIKEPPGAIEAAVVACLRDAGLLAHAVITSGKEDVLRCVKQIEPSVAVGLISNPPGLIERALAVGAAWIDPHKRACTPELVAEAHARGLRVTTWIVDDPAERDAFAAMGVDRVTSNDPARLLG